MPRGAIVLDSFPQVAAAPAVGLASYGGWIAGSRRESGGYSLVRHAAEQAVLPGLRGENTVESAVRSGAGVAWSSSRELAAGESGSTLVAPAAGHLGSRPPPRPHYVSPGF